MIAEHTLDQIVIVGGGTAGWMTAAALSKLIDNGRTTIRLIESDEIGTVGVGEATIPPILTFNSLLGIDENEFIRATQATFKLGIEFDGWWRDGDAYMHPFGNYGRDLEAVRFYQFWRKLSAEKPMPPLEAFSLSAVAARKHRFIRPVADPNSVLSGLAYAFHFDAGLYAAFLRRLSENRGCQRTEGRVVDVELRGTDGFIDAVRLDSGERVEGDLFIDCSGFRGLLIGEALGTAYEDWSRWLPCDRAVAVPSERRDPLLPYTRAMAREAGWQWRIPLQHRTGNGLVFCSEFMGADAAEAALLSGIDAPATSTPRHLSFVTGRRQQFWTKNCVAIGLSGGFMEPLESTSIHLIQAGITKLVALLPDKRFNPVEREEYNRLTAMQFEQIRDFLILHYKANERDGPFWRHVRGMDIPDSLATKIELFRSKGRIFRFEDELFDESNWVAVLTGQGILPESWDPMLDTIDPAQAEAHVGFVHRALHETAEKLPSHAEFIERFCKAGPLEQMGVDS